MKLLTSLARNGLVFPLACLAALAIVLISEGVYLAVDPQASTRWASSGVSQDSVQNLMQGMVDAETGTRGFLLTGNREYLEPYELALGQDRQAR